MFYNIKCLFCKMFLLPCSSNIQLTIVIFILFLLVGKSMNNKIKVTTKTHPSFAGKQEKITVEDKSKLLEHIKNLKQVNGLKQHNILRKQIDTGPLIYINNPVEANLPNAYFSADAVKEMLLNRVAKLRNGPTIKAHIEVSYTSRIIPFKTIKRGRIELKHIILKATPPVTSVQSTAKIKSKLKDDKDVVKVTHESEDVKKSHVKKKQLHTDITTVSVPTTHITKVLNKSQVKLEDRNTDTSTVPVTTIHFNEELKKSHVKIIHKDIHRLENHHLIPENYKSSSFTKDVDKYFTKPLKQDESNDTDKISAAVLRAITNPVQVEKLDDKVTSIEVKNKAVDERKEEESSTVSTEAVELNVVKEEVKESRTTDIAATDTSIVYKEAKESSITDIQAIETSPEAKESSMVTTEAEPSTIDIGVRETSSIPTEEEESSTFATEISALETTVSPKRTKKKKKQRVTWTVHRTLGRPNVFGG